MAIRQKSRRDCRNRSGNLARRRPQLEALETRSLLASFTTLEDTPLTIDIPTGQSAVIAVPPTLGGVQRTDAGDLIYRPAENAHGSDSFVYRVGDGEQATRETVSITVTPVNDPPRLHHPNLLYEVTQGVPYNSPPQGVLAHVTSLDFETLRASLVEGPTHGTLTLNADGSFVYQAPANYLGLDHFTYRASEGSAATDSVTGRVTLVVRPRDELPQAYHDQYSTPQDTILRVEAPGVLANDGHRLPVSLVSGPARGTVTLNANGSFVYTPPAGFNGVDTFVYRINDPAASSYPFNQGAVTPDDASALDLIRPRTEAKVTIRVGTIIDHPNAVDDRYALRQGAELNVAAPGVLANDVPRSNTSRLSAALVRGPEHGTLTLNADGSFSYKPNADFVGIDVFLYRTDDTAANTPPPDSPFANISVARVSLYVTADSPPLAAADNYAVQQNTPLSVAAPGVLGNDIGSGRPLAATLLTQPEHGTVVLNADGSFTYTPRADFYGVDTFRYQARDAAATTAAGNGSALGSVATVSLYVRPAKLPLIVNDDHFVAKQNTVLEVAAPGVLGNDYVLDIRPPYPPSMAITHVATHVFIAPPVLSATLLTGPTHGTVTLNTDGSFRYTPSANYVGPDSFTYRARWENGQDDPVFTGVGTVTISVHPTDRPPVTHDDYYVGLQDAPLEIAAPGVLGNDERPASAAFLPVVVTPPSRGTLTLNPNGSFRYVPHDGFSGQDFFSYRLQQAATTATGALQSNTANVRLTIRPNNPVVRAEDDHYATPAGTQLKIESPGVLRNDVAIPLFSPEIGGAIRLYAPFPITLTHALAPIRLTASLVRGPSYGTLTLNADGSFIYTPRADFSGVDTFTYKASAATIIDGSHLILAPFELGSNHGQPPQILPHDIATVTINVIPPGQGAVVARDNEYRLRRDTTLTIAPPGVLGNDFLLTLDPTTASGNAPQGNLTAELVAGPEHGTLTLQSGGGFTYAPAAGFTGLDHFKYRAVSGQHSDEATVYLRVVPPRPAPRFVIGPHQQVTDDAGARAIAGWTRPEAGDPAAGTQPTFAFDVSSDNASLFAAPPAIDANGRLTFTPAPNASGAATVTVVLRDSALDETGEVSGESAPQTFTITITKPNPRHNTERPLDVSRDAKISPIDAVLVINYLNARAARAESQTVATAVTSTDFLDTNKDNFISAIDAVLVINYLNSNPPTATGTAPEEAGGVIVYNMTYVEPQVIFVGEGESDPLAEALLLIADDAAEEAARKRRKI
jgi:hypothetical protein